MNNIEKSDRLIIIGNGFDLSCGRKTAYSNFREFLINKYSLNNDEIEKSGILFAPESQESHMNSERYDESDLSKWYIKLIDISENSDNISKWSDYEEILGRLEYSEILDNDQNNYDDDDGWGKLYNTEDICDTIYDAVMYCHNLFTDWIYSVEEDPAEISTECGRLLSYPNTAFLNFNYTDTLERYAGINSSLINHIHGFVGDSDSNLIVGHLKPELYSYRDCPGEEKLDELDSALEKDTEGIIDSSIDFFESLSNVTKIYFYGFSFGKVDLPYIDKVLDYTNNPVCYLNDFDTEELERQKKTLNEYFRISNERIMLYHA